MLAERRKLFAMRTFKGLSALLLLLMGAAAAWASQPVREVPAQAALEQSLRYVEERKQFGKQLSTFQALQFKLADMLTDLTASRQMVRLAAHKLDQGHAEADAPDREQQRRSGKFTQGERDGGGEAQGDRRGDERDDRKRAQEMRSLRELWPALPDDALAEERVARH